MAKPKVKIVEEVKAPVVKTEKAKVDIAALKDIVWNAPLEVMQDVVKKAVPATADVLTLQAAENVAKAKEAGIASQYIQQIIARN